MAQIPYRGNLSASTFPFLSENFGRSTIIRGQDQNYVPPVAARQDADKDVGIPQIYYCHNVLPTSEGFQSIGYVTRTPFLLPTEDQFRQIFTIRDEAEEKAFFSITADGRVFAATFPMYQWTEVTSSPTYAGKQVTVAFIQGVTYIYIATVGCFEYDFATNTLVPVTLTGLTATEIIGIAAVAGYLIAYSTTAIAWSSTIDPTDFTPSLATGAGGGIPEGLKGTIVFVAPSTTGMFIFTTTNCIPAIASGNIRFPFNFREIVNTGGISSQELVSYDTNSNNLWCYTTSGLQQVSTQQSQTLFPAVTDFISGNIFEDLDDSTLLLNKQKLTAPMQKKITVVSDRYLIISYGVTELTHALVYDLVLTRWGKLKITHVDCFEWLILSSDLVEAPKQSIGFLLKDGTIKTVNFDVESLTANGVLILGKFQLSRTRTVTLQEAAFENIVSSSNFTFALSTSFNGKYGDLSYPTLVEDDQLFKRYNCRTTGLNFSMIFKGGFNLVSFVLQMIPNGRR